MSTAMKKAKEKLQAVLDAKSDHTSQFPNAAGTFPINHAHQLGQHEQTESALPDTRQLVAVKSRTR